MEGLDVLEKRKIADIVRKGKGGGEAGSSMDWMYAERKSNTDDYLLGKKIDKHFEQGEDTPKEDDIFGERIKANIALDMQAKMREDPLYSIKKREEESRKKILHNPVKVKELQQLISQQKREKKKKFKKQKHRHQHAKGDDDLVQQYLSILSKKHDQRRDRKNKHTCSDTDDDDFDVESAQKKHKKKEHKHHSRTESDSDSDRDTHRRRYGLIKGNRCDRSRSRSPSCKTQRSPSQPEASYHYRQSEMRSKHTSKHTSKHKSKHERKHSLPQDKRKVSAEERDRKLQEMMDNAKWREDQRRNNVQRYREEDRRREERGKKKGSSADFLNPLMSEHATNSTVEDRLRRNKYNIQRTKSALDRDFTKQ